MRVKRSYGIICIKHTKGRPIELLLVKKAVSYYFAEFIAGNYSTYNNAALIHLFNNMTYDEKVLLMTMKFDNFWFKMYHTYPTPQNTNRAVFESYLRRKSKFERSFLRDGGRRLHALIKSSAVNETALEFPRGRCAAGETTIQCAVREIMEETRMPRTAYKILWHMRPYTESFEDYGCRYMMTYYFAVLMDHNFNPAMTFYNRESIAEVSYAAFLPASQLEYCICNKSTKKRLKKMFEFVKRKYTAYLFTFKTFAV